MSPGDNPFREWIRLEQPRLGTRVTHASDEFFAAKERLIQPADPVFIAGQALGLIIYGRNIYFIIREKRVGRANAGR